MQARRRPLGPPTACCAEGQAAKLQQTVLAIQVSPATLLPHGMSLPLGWLAACDVLSAAAAPSSTHPGVFRAQGKQLL